MFSFSEIFLFFSPLIFSLIMMRILRRQRKYWQVAGADLKATEAGAWFEIACAKNRAVIPNVSLIFHELPKEHMAVMHPHTANIHTHRNITHYSSSVHFFFTLLCLFIKLFGQAKMPPSLCGSTPFQEKRT